MMKYPITAELSVPVKANKRYEDLSVVELTKRGYRLIGGDKGDLRFEGYTVHEDRSVLHNPILVTGLALTQEDANQIASDILAESFNSIGAETIEHF